MNLFKKKIKTKEDIINYLNFLDSKDMLYHFDSDANEILTNVSDYSERLFTDEECVLVDKRRDEMLDLDYDLAFDYLIFAYDVEDMFK